MKVFFNLVQEVLKPGLCSGCGGCAVFCVAAGYGALDINKTGKPIYRDMEKCIECGLCYLVCPEVAGLDQEIKDRAAWSDPLGRVIETSVIRAKDPRHRDQVMGGGLVALLVHLFDQKRIDGAVIGRSAGQFLHRPFLAGTREDILALDHHSEFKGIDQFDPVILKKMNRVALVGSPCQIKSLRKMQVLNLVPSEAVKFCFGLFCSEIFIPCGTKSENPAGNSKGSAMALTACRYCADYSAEFADISFGKTGAAEGWTTVLARTEGGRKVLWEGLVENRIEQFNVQDNFEFATQAMAEVKKASSEKKKRAKNNRRNLKSRPVRVSV